MNSVIPTIFAVSGKGFEEKFLRVVNITPRIQIDFMDGSFVKAKSIKLKHVPNLKRLKNKFEAHLMVSNPKKYIRKLRNKGFGKVIFHYESVSEKQIAPMVERIRKNGMMAFVALNPETPIVKIVPFLDKLDGVLIMGVHPGRENQKFVNEVYSKIKVLRKLDKNVIIQVDGGVNEGVAKKLKSEGVNIINTGSFVSQADNPKDALGKLRRVFL